MKKIAFFIYLTLISSLFTSCFYCKDCKDEPFQEPYKAIIINRTELESSVQSLPPQQIIKSGKIYIKDNLMFINDVNKGFHVYNYSNPEMPVKIGFIQILGATDLAIRNNVVYINQAVDLVTLIYSPGNNTILITKRNKNVFPQKQSPRGSYANTNENEIVIDWINQ